ncbi:MAG: hypothetical protein K2H30_06550 [Clostridia bacterium]|nr:hypothetical protein [Clostridia bacterium]
MKGKALYLIIGALGMVALIVCFVIGALYRMDWLIFLGFGICVADFLAVGIAYGVKFIRELNADLKKNAQQERTPEEEAELLEKINSAKTREESLKARAEYYGEGAENAGDLISSAFGFSKEGKEAFKKAPASEKAKPVLIFVWLGLMLLTFMAGILLSSARIQPTGFIIMGVGGGLFFLTIIGFLIYSLVERRNYYSAPKSSKYRKPKKVVRRGVVKRCEVHSQHVIGRRTPKISGTLYQIWVWTSATEPLVRLVCSRKYMKNERVSFTETRGIRVKRRIIE